MQPEDGDEPLPPGVGSVIAGRFRLEAAVGYGAMGAVYRALDLSTRKPVALKLLAPAHARRRTLIERFQREATVLSGLAHRHLVPVIAAGVHSGMPYLAMALLEGETLAERLSRRAPLTSEEFLAVFRGAARGLDHLHAHHLVHRDIKPQNLFIERDGNIRLLDLGVVRQPNVAPLTQPGALVGTPYYMAPEQIRQRGPIDGRADVYALAAVAFEVLVGHPPYRGSTAFEVMRGHCALPVPRPSLLAAGLPRALDAVFARALAKDASGRPARASVFVEELAPLLSDADTEDREDTLRDDEETLPGH